MCASKNDLSQLHATKQPALAMKLRFPSPGIFHSYEPGLIPSPSGVTKLTSPFMLVAALRHVIL